MKSELLNYTKGMNQIEESLNNTEKKVLEDFGVYCRQTSGDDKVKKRKSEILMVKDIIEKPFNNWKLEELRGFTAVLNSSNRAVWTKKGILITLKMFLKWKFKDWSSRFNNFEEMNKLQKQLRPDNSQKYNKENFLTVEEIDLMIRKAKRIRDKLYISMASDGGLPPIVQQNLKFKDIKIDYPEENISKLTYFRNKNKNSFVCPLGKITTYYLKSWKQEYEYPNVREDDLIFPSPQDRSKPISSVTVWYSLKRLAGLCNIEKNVFQYLIRHKTLSDGYEKLTEEIHRKTYGHVKGSTQTKTYSHGDSEQAFKTALEILHKVTEISPEKRNKLEKEIEKLKEIIKAIQIEAPKIAQQVFEEEIQNFQGLLKKLVRDLKR